MARRRKFYARDRRGRFRRTVGPARAPMSRTKKVAIAGAAVAVAGGSAYGAHKIYRAGATKGFDVGKRQGIYSATPLRDNKGRIKKGGHKPTPNPYRRGMRPQKHGMHRGRPAASARNRVRATVIAGHRIKNNYKGKERLSHNQRTDRMSWSGTPQRGRHLAKGSRIHSVTRRRLIAGEVKGWQAARRVTNRITTTDGIMKTANSVRRAPGTAGRKVKSGVDSARLGGMYAMDSARAVKSRRQRAKRRR